MSEPIVSYGGAGAGETYLDQGGRGVAAGRDAPFPYIAVQPAATVLSANGNSTDYYSGGRGVDVCLNITAMTGTSPTLTLTIEGRDPISGQYFTLLASSAIAATGFTHLQASAGIAVAANSTANIQLPPIWRVRWTIGGSASPTVTCSISATPLA